MNGMYASKIIIVNKENIYNITCIDPQAEVQIGASQLSAPFRKEAQQNYLWIYQTSQHGNVISFWFTFSCTFIQIFRKQSVESKSFGEGSQPGHPGPPSELNVRAGVCPSEHQSVFVLWACLCKCLFLSHHANRSDSTTPLTLDMVFARQWCSWILLSGDSKATILKPACPKV